MTPANRGGGTSKRTRAAGRPAGANTHLDPSGQKCGSRLTELHAQARVRGTAVNPANASIPDHKIQRSRAASTDWRVRNLERRPWRGEVGGRIHGRVVIGVAGHRQTLSGAAAQVYRLYLIIGQKLADNGHVAIGSRDRDGDLINIVPSQVVFYLWRDPFRGLVVPEPGRIGRVNPGRLKGQPGCTTLRSRTRIWDRGTGRSRRVRKGDLPVRVVAANGYQTGARVA